MKDLPPIGHHPSSYTYGKDYEAGWLFHRRRVVWPQWGDEEFRVEVEPTEEPTNAQDS